MLKGISPVITPELLKVLYEMGHGDTVIFADAHFPSHTIGPQVIRMDCINIPDLLRAIMPLWELDTYVHSPFMMMEPVPGDKLDMEYVRECSEIVGSTPGYLERFAFYEQGKKAYAVIHTGETRQYGNVILYKGIIPSTPICKEK